MGKRFFVSFLPLVLLLTLPRPGFGIDKQESDRLKQARYSMLGIRLGAWVDREEKVVNESVSADFPDASFYSEFFYDHRFTKVIMAELSLGVVSRGDATFFFENARYIGTINLYPILLQLKFTPLSGQTRSVHPFIIGGGGFVFGRHRTDIISASGFFPPADIVEDKESAFLGVIGVGVDIALADQVGLTFAAKYHPIDFGDTLAEISDYSGLSISFGAAYYMHKK